MNRRAFLLVLAALGSLRAVQAQAPASSAAATPASSATFQAGQPYFLSIPYADSAALTASTTVAQAFSLPPASNGAENYRLFRYNTLRRTYEPLGASSLVRRGEGYAFYGRRSVSLRTPASDRTRFATGAAQFTVTLRHNASDRTPGRGFNLIGFPFDPAVYKSVDWLESTVVGPSGRSYPNVRAAASAGLLSPFLFSLAPGSLTQAATRTLVPFQGYYAQAYVDNVRVILKAKR